MNLAALCPLLSYHVKISTQGCLLIFYASLSHPFFFSCRFARTGEGRYFTTAEHLWTRHIPLHNYLQLLNDFNVALNLPRRCWYDVFIPKQEQTTRLNISRRTRRFVRSRTGHVTHTYTFLLLREWSSQARSLWHHNTCHLSTCWPCPQSQRRSEGSRLPPPPFHWREPRCWNLISAPLTMPAHVSLGLKQAR